MGYILYRKFFFYSIGISMLLFVGCTSNNIVQTKPSIIEKKQPQNDIISKVKVNPKEIPFEPTFNSVSNSSSRNIYKIYKASIGKATGIYIHKGIVFVIVNIDTQNEKLRYEKGTAMIRAKILIQKHFELKNFNITTRQLEDRNYRKEGIYRYAIAFSEKDVLKLKNNSK